jgi:hypothetical protein
MEKLYTITAWKGSLRIIPIQLRYFRDEEKASHESIHLLKKKKITCGARPKVFSINLRVSRN